MRKILIVEDTESLREIISSVVVLCGYEPICVNNVGDALKALNNYNFCCILSDYKLITDLTGVDLLRKIRAGGNQTPFVLLTAFASIDIAVEAMKAGANDFLTKPFDPNHLAHVIEQIVNHKQIIDRENPRRSLERRIITKSSKMFELLDLAEKAARVDVPVFINGESGTGKELLARFIHEQSSRNGKPFVAVNCAAIPSELLESEFFGHEAGSFTGATQRRIGVFEYASEGTLFLDEIGDMPKHLQVKLLRALQEKEIRRVGSDKLIPVNPRIISATHKTINSNNPESNSIREDLYYRLSVVQFALPPLRDRKEDIDLLIDYYINLFSLRFSIQRPTVSPQAFDQIKAYSWPGNVRELENIIERAVIFCNGIIESQHLQIPMIKTASSQAMGHGVETVKGTTIIESNEEMIQPLSKAANSASREAEIKLIRKALSESKGNKTVAAKLIDVSYKTLLAKIKEYEL